MSYADLHSRYVDFVIAFALLIGYSVSMMNGEMTMTTWMSADEAVDHLMHLTREDLSEIVWDAYKDQYNVRPRHMSNYTHSELVSWYLSHYEWNEGEQFWQSIVPFVYDEEESYA